MAVTEHDTPPPPSDPRPWSPLLTVVRGMAMGISDAIPGVSGGTIALILGFYDRLIAAIHTVIRLPRHWRSPAARSDALRAFGFLLPLGFGAGLALVVALRLLVGDTSSLHEPLRAGDPDALRAQIRELPGLLVDQTTAPVVFAFFFGLVAMSIGAPWARRRVPARMDLPLACLAALCSGAIALSPAIGGSRHPVMAVLAGAIALSVMLLPGISGSLALLLIGMYQPVAGAVSTMTHAPEPGAAVFLLWFALGMLLGAIGFVPFLRHLLLRRHDRVMPVLSGLMAGSLVALWPWKHHYVPEAIPVLGPMGLAAPQGAWWWALLAAVAGAGTIALARHTVVDPGT
ncbi:MAG: DUF368 domain-containing protein [Planctomycetota bacterium]